MRWILSLYPRAWHERYGEEMGVLLDEYPASLLTAADLFVGALVANVDQVLWLLRQHRGFPPIRREQAISLGLGLGWAIPWLIVMHDQRTILLLPVIGSAFLELAFMKPSARELLGTLAGALGLGWILGHLLGVLAAAIAAWAGWASWDPAPRTGLYIRLVVAFIMLTMLVLEMPQWWPVLPAAMGFGVLGLVEGQRPVIAGHRHWWGFGMAVVMTSAGLSLLVYGLDKFFEGGLPLGWVLLPLGVGVGTLVLGGRYRPNVRYGSWRSLAAVGVVIAGVAGTVLLHAPVSVLIRSRLPLRAMLLTATAFGVGLGALVGRRPLSGGRPVKRWAALAIATAGIGFLVYFAAAPRGALTGSSPESRCATLICMPPGLLGRLSWSKVVRREGPLVVPLAVGAVLLGAGVWSRRRLLYGWDPTEVAGPESDRALERRAITPPPEAFADLYHTRLVMYQGLRQAAGRPYAPNPGETVREWFCRVYGPSAMSVVVLYEEVRYGEMTDSAERAAAILRCWPTKPRGYPRLRPQTWWVTLMTPRPGARVAQLFMVLGVVVLGASTMGAALPPGGVLPVQGVADSRPGRGASGHRAIQSSVPVQNSRGERDRSEFWAFIVDPFPHRSYPPVREASNAVRRTIMSTSDGPWIVAESLTRIYGDMAAVRSLSFAIEQGSHWAIVGPSGSGKSTLLYLLGALDRPSSGLLTIGGHELSRLDAEARAAFRYHTVGFVFQEFHLLEDLTVEENVLLPFVGRPRDRRTHREQALWLLEEVNLGDHIRKPAGVLSGGEKQRVAVARALVNDPPMLLCDEPTGNLDQKTGAQVMDLLVDLAGGEIRKTLVVVTHDPAVASRFTNQIHLRDGEIVQGPS